MISLLRGRPFPKILQKYKLKVEIPGEIIKDPENSNHKRA